MAADEWTCHWMKDCVSYVADELRDRDLLQSWVEPTSIWEGILRPCAPCRNLKKKPSSKKCRGWRLDFRDHQALWFRPTTVRGHTLQVVFEGTFNASRPQSWKGSWPTAPMTECSVALQLIDAETGEQLSRQHLDLANVGQNGPVWHVQLGGVGSNAEAKDRRLIGELRWPAGPTDFMLSIELCLYLFHNDSWSELVHLAAWTEQVKASERLILRHYIDAMTDYQQRPSSQPSWLAAQCNLLGSLDPRPVGS